MGFEPTTLLGKGKEGRVLRGCKTGGSDLLSSQILHCCITFPDTFYTCRYISEEERVPFSRVFGEPVGLSNRRVDWKPEVLNDAGPPG